MSATPILAALAAAAGATVGVWYWLKKKRGREDLDVIIEPEPTPPGPKPPGPEPSPKEAKTYCASAGKHYDVERWASPVHVMAGMIALGYPVSNTLVTASDKLQIKALQRAFRDQKIGPYAKAKESWIHGNVGPCFLLSMSAAEDEGIYVKAYEG